MEVFDDLLEEYKNNRKSVIDSTEFTAKKFFCRGTKTGSTHCYGPLADKSNAFSSFLTVSRKLKYSCLYIFHINYPEE